jgi:hypothetical protein
MAKNLALIAKQKKIKYFLISFVDLFGVLRSKLVPAGAIKDMQKNGAGFAGFATWLDMTPSKEWEKLGKFIINIFIYHQPVLLRVCLSFERL